MLKTVKKKKKKLNKGHFKTKRPGFYFYFS